MPHDPRRLTKDEINYIRDNCGSKTDEELAKDLNRSIIGIRKARKRHLGVIKDNLGQVPDKVKLTAKSTKTKIDPDTGKNIAIAHRRLNEKQRQSFFKSLLANSLYYETLKAQFSEDEMDFYLEEWGSLCVQFEDILATEKRQIDELIKAEIAGNRIGRNIKISEDIISEYQIKINEFRNKANLDTEEDQEKDRLMIAIVNTMMRSTAAMANDQEKNMILKSKLFENLNARRVDRIDQIEKSGMTFHGVIGALREKQNREIQGRHMELVRLAKENKKNQFRKPVIFPDSSKSAILLDDKSVEDDKIASILFDDNKSILIEEYRNEKKDRFILIIENDIERIQYFQQVFPMHKLDYAGEVGKAIEKINEKSYDLICFDYDLDLDRKSDEVASYILTNEKSPLCDVLIHSVNENGAEILNDIFAGKRRVELFSFKKIYESNGG